MKKAAYAALLLLAACSSQKHSTSPVPAPAEAQLAPQRRSVQVDGSNSDWQDLPLTFSPSGALAYTVVQDSAHLFVLCRVEDAAEQMKLLRGGLQVWFDPGATHAQTTGVAFPVKGQLSAEELRPAEGERLSPQELHLHIRGILTSMNRVGFRPESSGVQTIHAPTGFSAAIGWAPDGALLYELAVPFNAFPQPVQAGNWQVSFTLDAPDKPVQAAGTRPTYSGGGGGGGMRGGGGGMRGAGMRGGGMRSGNDEARNGGAGAWKKLYEKENFWATYSLSR